MKPNVQAADKANQPPWQHGHFNEPDNDPLTGFANIMDVMLVFALGLMLALISQSRELREHFQLEAGVQVDTGEELLTPPEAIQDALEGHGDGLESLGQVYRDPETGKLILIERE